jgi:signal transduction histidine kinase
MVRRFLTPSRQSFTPPARLHPITPVELNRTEPLSMGMLDLPFALWSWDVDQQAVHGDAMWDSFFGPIAEAAAKPGIGWKAFCKEGAWDDFNHRLRGYLHQAPKIHLHIIVVETGDRTIEYILHGMVIERHDSGAPKRVSGLCRHMYDHEFGPDLDFDLGQQRLEERRKIEAILIKAQRFEGIGKLAGGMAHDLNNLLAPIRMATELLQRKCTDGDVAKYLSIIQASTDRARGVIQQVLSFSRNAVDEGDPRTINPEEVLRDLENIAHETFPKRIETQFVIARDCGHVRITPTSLHQVLLNLLINARDAIPEEGRITVHCRSREFAIGIKLGDRSFEPGRYVCIQVSDTGVGIAPDIRARIFDPFFTTKPKGQGTGLGLASAYGITVQAGGFMDVHSEVGKGSTFTVFLPYIEPPPAAPTAVAESATTPWNYRQLLLVCDDEPLIQTLQPTLEQLGLRVLIAHQTSAALNILRRESGRFSYLLIDVRLRRFAAQSFASEVRGLGSNAALIFMSGDPEGRHFDLYRELGLLLNKPFQNSDLRHVLAAGLKT